jgi:outer membrane protein assembly factor BamB/tetratricopeptide (TPR) repeat protein
MVQRSLRFLGRSQHLAAFEEGIGAARHGRREAFAVAGGPGTGKSRLLDECELRLAVDDLDVRRAAAFPAATTRPGNLAELLRLDELDVERPGVLLVDDAQWADPTSLKELRSLLLRPAQQGLLVVLAHRPLGEREAPALRRLLEVLDRRGGVRRMGLGPLSAPDLLEVCGGSEPAALADRLIVASGGVPLALEELVDQLLEAGALRLDAEMLMPARPLSEWPEIRSLHERVAQLPAEDRRLVHTAALAGRPLPLDVVAALLEQDADEALDSAERLVDEGFFAEDPDGFRPRSGTEAESLAAELGDVRAGRILGALADAVVSTGLDERDPGLIGTHYLRARRWEEAAPRLADAGLEAANRRAYAEALPLVSGALEALERLGSADARLQGRLYFARAQCHRMLGWSSLAAEDAAEASRLLTGGERMRALGWQAQIADDEQRAAEGEWLTAFAELEAARLGDEATRGVQLTLRARMLGRLGFPSEADACLTRGIRLLRQHGDPYLHFLGHWNGAWVAFDRGQVRQAAAGFEYSVRQAERFEGEEWLANAQAWWSRSLFWTGRIREALDAHDRARDAADRGDGWTPVFLTALSRAEGMILLGRYADAEEAAGEALDLIRRLGLAWENAGRYVLAAALLGQGRTDDALAEAERALAACPPGADGRRWRAACRALVLEVRGARGEPWPDVVAAGLARELLAARWLIPAARLLTARARYGADAGAARRAVALAMELGAPMFAARAVAAGDLWGEPVAAAVAAAIEDMAASIPEGWRVEWAALPEVEPALRAPPADPDQRHEAADRLEADLRDTLAWVGLDPADLRIGAAEWTAPLPRPEVVTPQRRRAVLVAGAAAVLLIGGGAVGTQLVGSPEPVPAAEPQEASPVAEPEPGLPLIPATERTAGSWTFRGGPGRTGVPEPERSGVPDPPVGMYWELCTGQPVRSSPAVHGNFVYFGSDDGDFYALSIRDGGSVLWNGSTDGPIRSSPVVEEGVGVGGLAGREAMVFVGSDDHTVRAWTASDGEERWTYRTGGPVRSSPIVVDGVVYVGSQDGRLYALRADGDNPEGELVWQFPDAGEEDVGRIESSPAVAGDLVIVGSDDGHVYAVNRQSGTLAWQERTGGSIVATPVVHEDVVYVGSRDRTVHALRLADGRPAAGGYFTGQPVESSPAVADGTLYIASRIYLLAIDLATGRDVWDAGFATGDRIESSPAVTGDVVYIGSNDGNLYAIDRATGTERWRFETSRRITSSPAIADGAVIIGSWDQCVYALGPAGNGD